MLTSRSIARCLLGLSASALAVLGAGSARAFSPFLVVPEPAVAEASPAYRYANMSNEEAFEELDRRKILYTKLASVPGVRAPIRLTGRLHGVHIHSSLPPEQRVTSMFEILDARLALALDDFAAVLERHDIDELVHFTMYRPNVPAPSTSHEDHPEDPKENANTSKGARPRKIAAPKAPTAKAPTAKAPPPVLEDKGTIAKDKGEERLSGLKQKSPAAAPKKAPELVRASKAPKKSATKKAPSKAPSKATSGKKSASRSSRGSVARRDPAASGPHKTTWAPPGTRHPAGLAIDVGLLHKRDGRWLSVAHHYRGHLGDKTCGEGARVADVPEAKELRSLVCEASDLGIFTYVLTPNYNAAHADHYHMEIKPGVRWFLYH